ncbi:MAG: cyclase family protein [Sneathiellaceae bacterium]
MRGTTRLLGLAVMASLVASGAALADNHGRTIEKSPYGADDEAGAAGTLLTPEVVKAGAALITEGKVYSLGIETNSLTPAYPPRGWKTYVVQPGQQGGTVPFPNGGTYNDDIVSGWLGIGSQIDGLGHVGVQNVYYNQNKAADFADVSGLKKLGVENIPPIATRGILLDIAKQKGKDILDPGPSITMADYEQAVKDSGLTIRKGDVVLFHTGWMNMLDKDPATFGSAEPGVDPAICEDLAAKGAVAVGADTWGLDAIPPMEGNDVFPCHVILLGQHGVYILENMDTRELAKDGVKEFFFTLGAGKISGAVQMIINPVAIR